MASSSSSGRRGLPPFRKSAAENGKRASASDGKRASVPLDHDQTRLSRELEEIRQRELELKKEHEEIQRRVADLPRQIEERERKQREMIRLRAMAMATTADGFSRPRDKRHSAARGAVAPRRRTRPEERSARLQLVGLILVLAVVLVLLCKSLPR